MPDDATATVAKPDDIFDETLTMPGHLLRRCQQIAVSIFLAECREFDLTPLQFAVLSALDQHRSLDQVRLAGFAALDRTTVGVVTRKLEQRGLVSRRSSDKDRRSVLIALTATGKALLRRALPGVQAAQARILAPLRPDERVIFTEMLGRIAEVNNAASRAPLRPS